MIELPSAGDYEYRVLGVLPGDVEVTQKTGQATVGGGTATTAATSAGKICLAIFILLKSSRHEYSPKYS